MVCLVIFFYGFDFHGMNFTIIGKSFLFFSGKSLLFTTILDGFTMISGNSPWFGEHVWNFLLASSTVANPSQNWLISRIRRCQKLQPPKSNILLMEEIRLTGWDGKSPIIYQASYMLGGAGFLPSTVGYQELPFVWGVTVLFQGSSFWVSMQKTGCRNSHFTWTFLQPRNQ